MTDQQLALQAMSDAQHILEEFLQPRPHNDKRLLERLVEVLERPDVVVAVDRLQRANGGEKTRRVESAGLSSDRGVSFGDLHDRQKAIPGSLKNPSSPQPPSVRGAPGPHLSSSR